MLTLTRADLNLLKTLASNQNSSIKLNDSSTAKYQQRHELSNKRVEKWPNTLEAIRKKKEEFLIEKDKERERKNAELDRQVIYDCYFFRETKFYSFVITINRKKNSELLTVKQH